MYRLKSYGIIKIRKKVNFMTKTRFAPSLSGYMHIGNLRSALFAYLIAKQDEGEFVLRIEDTDRSRSRIGVEEQIYNILNAFQLTYDEGPHRETNNTEYVQSKRLDIYKSYAEKLLKKGEAYYCFCDKKTLNANRMKASEEKQNFLYEDPCRIIGIEEAKNRVLAGESYTIRQKMPKTGQTSFRDLVYGDITFDNSTLEDQILIKSDGFPTYNFANVIDDALMEITHVTRGCEYLSSMPKYLLLYEALNFPRPEFVHLPLVRIKEKGVLIKNYKEDDLMDLLNQGFLPSAIINYMALLGWNPRTNQEFFTLQELINEFDISKITKRPCCYDIKKLEWFNKHYISKMNDQEYINFTRPYLENVYNLKDKTEEWINNLLLLFKKHLHFGSEIALVSNLFFRKTIILDEKCINYLRSDELIPSVLTTFKEEVENCSDWNLQNIEELLKRVELKTNSTKEKTYMPIRIVVTGLNYGRELSKTLFLLEQQTIIKRVENSIGMY